MVELDNLLSAEELQALSAGFAKSNVRTVTVSIFDKEYQVSCKTDEVAALRQSAQYVDKKMREIKSSSTILGLDRIAVMTALNIANEFLSASQKTENVITSQAAEITHLTDKLDQALNRLKSINR
jgi:cell division protein ZapA